MPRFFYKDCVVSNLQRADHKGDVFTAFIDGRKASRLIMDNRVFHYLIGPGKNTKNRIWFYDPGFKKGLVVAGVGGGAEFRNVERNMSFNTQYKLATRPIIAGILAWFAAWVLLTVPVLTLYGGNARNGVHFLETTTVVIGCGTAALFLAHALWVVNKMKNLDRWRTGSTDSYTKELSSAPAAPLNKPKVKAAAKAATELVD